MMIEKDEMEKFYGEWVLLFDDKIIKHSQNLEEILRIAKDFSPDEVTIARIPPLPLNTIKFKEG